MGPADRLIRAWPDSSALLLLHAQLVSVLAGSFEAASDFEGARVMSAQFLDELVALSARFPKDPEVLQALSVAHNRLAYDLRALGRLDEAVPHYGTIVELRERLVRDYPTDLTYRRNLFLAYDHEAGLLGVTLADVPGNRERARAYLRKEGALEEAALADSPNHPTQFDYAEYLMTAASLADSGDEASGDLRKAAGLLESLIAAEPGVIKYRRELCTAHLHLGTRLLAAEQAGEAEADFRQAGTLANSVMETLPGDRYALAQWLDAGRGRAQSLAAQGDRTGALDAGSALVKRALAGLAFDSDRDIRQSFVAEAYFTLGSLQSQFGNWPEARSMAEQAIARLGTVTEPNNRKSNQKLLRDSERLLEESVRSR
jgi:tetratricopeptide (TPR) repeat protein